MKDREKVEELKKRAQLNIDGIRQVLASDEYQQYRESEGIRELNDLINSFKPKSDPRENLQKLIDLASGKQQTLGEALGNAGQANFFKGLARAGKRAVGKVKPMPDLLYSMIKKIDLVDPYEFEGKSVEIGTMTFQIKRAEPQREKTDDIAAKKETKKHERPSPPGSTETSPRRGSIKRGRLFDSDSTEQEIHPAILLVQEMNQLSRIQRRDYNANQVFLSEHFHHSYQLSTYDEPSPLILDNVNEGLTLESSLMNLIECFRAAYYPKFNKAEFRVPENFEKTFANVMTILKDKPKDKITAKDLEAIRDVIINIHNVYQTHEEEKSRTNRPD